MGAVALHCISPAIRIMQRSQQFIEWSSHSLTIKTTIIWAFSFALCMQRLVSFLFHSFHCSLHKQFFSVDRFHDIFFFLARHRHSSSPNVFKIKRAKKTDFVFFSSIFCVAFFFLSWLFAAIECSMQAIETGSLFYATYFDWAKSS